MVSTRHRCRISKILTAETDHAQTDMKDFVDVLESAKSFLRSNIGKAGTTPQVEDSEESQDPSSQVPEMTNPFDNEAEAVRQSVDKVLKSLNDWSRQLAYTVPPNLDRHSSSGLWYCEGALCLQDIPTATINDIAVPDPSAGPCFICKFCHLELSSHLTSAADWKTEDWSEAVKYHVLACKSLTDRRAGYMCPECHRQKDDTIEADAAKFREHLRRCKFMVLRDVVAELRSSDDAKNETVKDDEMTRWERARHRSHTGGNASDMARPDFPTRLYETTESTAWRASPSLSPVHDSNASCAVDVNEGNIAASSAKNEDTSHQDSISAMQDNSVSNCIETAGERSEESQLKEDKEGEEAKIATLLNEDQGPNISEHGPSEINVDEMLHGACPEESSTPPTVAGPQDEEVNSIHSGRSQRIGGFDEEDDEQGKREDEKGEEETTSTQGRPTEEQKASLSLLTRDNDQIRDRETSPARSEGPGTIKEQDEERSHDKEEGEGEGKDEEAEDKDNSDVEDKEVADKVSKTTDDRESEGDEDSKEGDDEYYSPHLESLPGGFWAET